MDPNGSVRHINPLMLSKKKKLFSFFFPFLHQKTVHKRAYICAAIKLPARLMGMWFQTLPTFESVCPTEEPLLTQMRWSNVYTDAILVTVSLAHDSPINTSVSTFNTCGDSEWPGP